MGEAIAWIYFEGEEGSTFARRGEYTLSDHPANLRDIMLYLNANRDVHDMMFQTDCGKTKILKRKKEGETITSPQ